MHCGSGSCPSYAGLVTFPSLWSKPQTSQGRTGLFSLIVLCFSHVTLPHVMDRVPQWCECWMMLFFISWCEEETENKMQEVVGYSLCGHSTPNDQLPPIRVTSYLSLLLNSASPIRLIPWWLCQSHRDLLLYMRHRQSQMLCESTHCMSLLLFFVFDRAPWPRELTQERIYWWLWL